jgi:hypothetical protein
VGLGEKEGKDEAVDPGGVRVGKIVGDPGSVQEEIRSTKRSIRAKSSLFTVLFVFLNSFLTILTLIAFSPPCYKELVTVE